MGPLRKAKERLLNRLAASMARRGAPAIATALLNEPQIFGPPHRLHIAKTAVINNALFNCAAGDIFIGEWGMLAHGVSLLTGAHDVTKFGYERQITTTGDGKDIHVGEGAWLATNVTVLGPCRIGDHAVVAAGALVRRDVPPYTIVAGVPARVIGEVAH